MYMRVIIALCILAAMGCTAQGSEPSSTQSNEPAQSMRAVDELVVKKDSGWDILLGWKETAKNRVEILPRKKKAGREALHFTQVTTYSLLGAVVYESGGILIDNGWLRILGAGTRDGSRSLPSWNTGKTQHLNSTGYLLVADDVLGGFFALNGGAFYGVELGHVVYLEPAGLGMWRKAIEMAAA